VNHLEELIAKLCPNGVPFEPISVVVQRGSTVRWADVEGQEFQYIDLTSVDRVTHAITETQTITSENAPSRAQQIVQEGDILFGTTRPMLKRYTVVPSEYDKQIASTGYCVLRPKQERILANFLFHLLGTANFYAFVEANERGASYPAIPDGVVKQFKIPIPPVEVQQEIVQVLDRFQTLEAELESELNRELASRRVQYVHHRDAALAFPDGGGIRWVTIPEIATNLDSRRKPVTKSARKPGEIPYYGASGIVDYVSDYIFDGDYLLVSEDGANLLARSTPIAFSISGKTWVNNHAHILEFPTHTERRFVEIYLNSIDLAPFVTGGAQAKLSQTNLNKIPIPVPSIEEQERIVSFLDKFKALVDKLSVSLSAELKSRRKQYEHYRDLLLTFKELAV